MNCESWNTPPRQEENLQIQDRECIPLEKKNKWGGQKGSMTCCDHAGSNPRDLRARTQDIVDNEVAQTDSQRKFERLTRKDTAQFEQGTMQSSTGGTAMAAGRHAPDMTTDPEDCDGWTQQVVDRNKKCCGANSGHLGHLFESQKVSEREMEELANIEKLDVAETTLQEARTQASEVVYSGRCGEKNAGRSNCDQKQ